MSDLSVTACHNIAPLRSGSAPPSRGYEKPVPLPLLGRNTNHPLEATAGILRQLPPRNPVRGILSTTSSSTKKRRVTQRKVISPLEDEGSLAKQCSLAMSRTESIMISAAGDVIVCRCRRSSTPFIPPKSRDPLDAWNRQFPCCDTDLLSNMEGPWSPVLENLTTHTKNLSSSHTIASDNSTYEWEKNIVASNKLDKKHVLGKSCGLKGGSVYDNQKEKSFSFIKEHSSRTRQIDSKSNCPSVTFDADTEPPGDSAIDGANGKEVTDDSSSHDSIWESNISDLILSLPSFDYSHIHAGHNDMVPHEEQHDGATPSTKEKEKRRKKQSSLFPTIIESPEEKKDVDAVDRENIPDLEPRFFHGVPIFLSTLSQVRIRKVSAHPLGAHVLMISAEALLFTYGLNHHGQLGIGIKSQINNENRGFHTTPTLVTPLLENGGKAMNCAAGVDHSLVVVATEGRRLQKLQTKPGVAYSDHGAESLCVPKSTSETTNGRIDHLVEQNERFHFSEKSVQYHQLYAFGRNNFMKLGLVRPHANDGTEPGSAEDSVLPRRVALHCTVWPHQDDWTDSSLPPEGVFDIAASAEHSAALVRRATGDVEVYMWGNASLGALGLPINLATQEISGEIARRPIFKKSNISPLPTIVEMLSYRRSVDPHAPFATQLSLGPYCSFVVMSNGKCMSCGFSAEGMLGQGYNMIHSMEPKEVFFPPDSDAARSRRIVSVSAGAFHVIALTENGKAYSWGINSNDRLGLGAIDYSTIAVKLPEKKEDLVVIEWVPQKIDVTPKITAAARKCCADKRPSNLIARVCAGYDSSIMVTRLGQVLSFGKRSGRLGKGEMSTNVNTPQPMYGGLHLFHPRNARDELALNGATCRPKRVQSVVSLSKVEK